MNAREMRRIKASEALNKNHVNCKPFRDCESEN